jgi:hypothetical protein
MAPLGSPEEMRVQLPRCSEIAAACASTFFDIPSHAWMGFKQKYTAFKEFSFRCQKEASVVFARRGTILDTFVVLYVNYGMRTSDV